MCVVCVCVSLCLLRTLVLQNVTPATAAQASGQIVTLTGTRLGNGSDITLVTLAGVPATAILSQSNSTVVVAAGFSPTTLGVGNVTVTSVSRGTAVLVGGFAYTHNGACCVYVCLCVACWL